jgi:signal transduction histidine kinase
MAVIGCLAIRRDKAAVEQEARQRAGEILQQLAQALPARVAGQLSRFDSLPETDKLRPCHLWFGANQTLVGPPEYDQPPRPPDWFLTLSAPQRRAWEALRRAESTEAGPAELTAALKQFLELNPPAEARANAEFVQLRNTLTNQPADQAIAKLLAFINEHPHAPAESGVPLSNLALAEALRAARQAGQLGQLLPALRKQLLEAPSALVPELLEQADQLAADKTDLQIPLQFLRTLWASQERLREMAAAIRQAGLLRNPGTTNLWFDFDQQGRWFCTVGSGTNTARDRQEGGSAPESTNQLTEVRLYPKALVEYAFVGAMDETKMAIPDYFGLAVDLEGEPLNFDVGRWTLNVGSSAFHGRPGTWSLESKGEHPTFNVQHPTSNALPVRESPKLRFGLQLYLADPEQLFAQQRQRTLIFGGLIAASTLAALIGLAAAYRSFHRQLRLNELKSNFVSSVSHELRAPIASVRLMAESLERGKVPDAPKQQEYFRFISQECRRLSSLIENVLDFSRIEQGRKQYEFEPTDLAALVRQTVKLMETYAAERQIRLAIQESSTSHPQPLLDGKAIQQALINLIDNALKHSPKGETVTVGWEQIHCKTKADPSDRSDAPQPNENPNNEPPSTPLLLWVEDHGEGIPPAEHDKIFERFYRCGSELRRQTQGVGIGLSIVKHIIEAHGGKVRVRSDVGQGSRFTIELSMPSDTESKSETRNPKAE